MPVIKGTQSITPIYKGADKIGKIYKGLDLVYQSFVYNPVAALIERTIENVDVELTNEITSIGDYAFQNCIYLKSITIPDSVTSIGIRVWEGCTELTNIRLLASIPPTLANAESISLATTTIYVPTGAKTSYESAYVWKNLLTRETNPVTFVEV